VLSIFNHYFVDSRDFKKEEMQWRKCKIRRNRKRRGI